MFNNDAELMSLLSATAKRGTEQLLSLISEIPGYKVLEFDMGHTVLTIPSGFTLDIRRLGPYVFDVLYDQEDMRDPGPFKIIVRLMEKLRPPGIEQEILYTPPEAMPDQDEHPQAWAYYQQWLLYERKRMETRVRLTRARVELILLSAVAVVDGPANMDDDDWLTPMLPLVGQPETVGNRILLFYKTQVIRSNITAAIIRELTTTMEVNLKGIKSALDYFRGKLETASVVGVD